MLTQNTLLQAINYDVLSSHPLRVSPYSSQPAPSHILILQSAIAVAAMSALLAVFASEQSKKAWLAFWSPLAHLSLGSVLSSVSGLSGRPCSRYRARRSTKR